MLGLFKKKDPQRVALPWQRMQSGYGAAWKGGENFILSFAVVQDNDGTWGVSLKNIAPEANEATKHLPNKFPSENAKHSAEAMIFFALESRRKKMEARTA